MKYAQFRAVEICRNSHFLHANIIDIFDKSIRQNVIKTTGDGWGPSYGFGMYPYYSRYSSFAIGASFNSMSSESWSDVVIYPYFEVVYNCANKIFRPQLVFKELSAEDLKHLVKDIKGAIQIEKVLPHSPNKDFWEVGDIILKVNNTRIEKVFEVIQYFDETHLSLNVQLMRDGKILNRDLKAIDITEEVKEAEKSLIFDVCHQTQRKSKRLKSSSLCV